MYQIVEAETPQLLMVAFDIRHKVFVLEQGVSATLEHDSWDAPGAAARHFLVFKDEVPVGACRVLWPYEDDPAVAKIQRVCVLPHNRGAGAGEALMGGVHMAMPSVETFKLSSQLTAVGLYKKLGYAFDGGEYREAGIPHRAMFWNRKAAEAAAPK